METSSYIEYYKADVSGKVHDESEYSLNAIKMAIEFINKYEIRKG